MSAIKITVPVTIMTDDKYCDEWCMQLRGERETISYTAQRRLVLGPYRCALFDTPIQRCLGGGPLRCQACLEAKEKPTLLGIPLVEDASLKPGEWKIEQRPTAPASLVEELQHLEETIGNCSVNGISKEINDLLYVAAQECKNLALKYMGKAEIVTQNVTNLRSIWGDIYQRLLSSGVSYKELETVRRVMDEILSRYRPQTDIVEVVKAEAVKWANKPTIGFEADEYDRVKGISQGLYMAVEIISRHTGGKGVV